MHYIYMAILLLVLALLFWAKSWLYNMARQNTCQQLKYPCRAVLYGRGKKVPCAAIASTLSALPGVWAAPGPGGNITVLLQQPVSARTLQRQAARCGWHILQIQYLSADYRHLFPYN